MAATSLFFCESLFTSFIASEKADISSSFIICIYSMRGINSRVGIALLASGPLKTKRWEIIYKLYDLL